MLQSVYIFSTNLSDPLQPKCLGCFIYGGAWLRIALNHTPALDNMKCSEYQVVILMPLSGIILWMMSYATGKLYVRRVTAEHTDR